MQDFKKNNNSELEIEKNTEKSEKKSPWDRFVQGFKNIFK